MGDAPGASRRLVARIIVADSRKDNPDGRHVVCVSHRSGAANLWRVDMEGRDLRQMTSHGSEDNRPRYTGDGKWITFQSFSTGRATL